MKATILLVLAAGAYAQQPPVARPEFDVVSLKPGAPGDPSSGVRPSPAGLQMTNALLATIVRSAYKLNQYQLDGGPKWINSERFTVDVKFPAGTSKENIALMMQSMLADRFKLQAHWASKTISQYALVAAKGGPKLQASNQDERKSNGTSQGPKQIKGKALAMSRLASMEAAVNACEEEEQIPYLAAARYRLSRLVEEPRRTKLLKASNAWMEHARVQDVERFCSFLSPGDWSRLGCGSEED